MLGASFNVAADFNPDVQGCVGYTSTRILVGVNVLVPSP